MTREHELRRVAIDMRAHVTVSKRTDVHFHGDGTSIRHREYAATVLFYDESHRDICVFAKSFDAAVDKALSRVRKLREECEHKKVSCVPAGSER